ncbi:MAG: hypothetical protein FWE95_02280 [Planctomycetaceae bacterium]|nr:hypothetical protein [Planctomycetaceae bacterium]
MGLPLLPAGGMMEMMETTEALQVSGLRHLEKWQTTVTMLHPVKPVISAVKPEKVEAVGC